MAAGNSALGQFDLAGIPPAPRGTPQIEVTFDIDANGLVSVRAKDTATGKQQEIVIQASGGLSEEDIQRMVRDADANVEADGKRRKAADLRNHADGLVEQAEKSLKEHGAGLPPFVVSEVQSAVTAVRTALDGTDTDALERANGRLGTASARICDAVYGARAA